jgi:hypothetical protein
MATALGLNLTAVPHVRIELAVTAHNQAARQLMEAGLLLSSVKADVPHDEFMAMLDERGMHFQRAYELMRGAAFVARLPADQRDEVLTLPKTKVLALANASPAVVEAMLEDGEADLNLIGVRELRARLRELEANLADTTVQRDTAEAEAEGLKKKLSKAPKAREDGVPMVVADLRAEIMAEGKKGSLAIDALNAVGNDCMALIGTEEAHDWADATLRLAFSQVAALRVQLDGLLVKYARELPGQDPTPAQLSYLSQQEIVEAAQAHEQLTKVGQYEAELRKWEREQERPRGKGRPAAKPVAPAA